MPSQGNATQYLQSIKELSQESTLLFPSLPLSLSEPGYGGGELSPESLSLWPHQRAPTEVPLPSSLEPGRMRPPTASSSAPILENLPESFSPFMSSLSESFSLFMSFQSRSLFSCLLFSESVSLFMSSRFRVVLSFHVFLFHVFLLSRTLVESYFRIAAILGILSAITHRISISLSLPSRRRPSTL